MTAMKEDVDDRFAGIDIDSLLNRTDHRPLSYGRKKALYEAPEFIQRLNGEETVMEGQSLCIECKIRGFPVPTLRWFKDDEEILDHPRIHVESNGTGGYSLIIDNAHKGDEAAYRCRAENVEGACSSFFFLSVKCRPKSQKKKDQKNCASRRTVSFPPMFATIVEKVEEEEKQGKEFQQLPPSPMTDFYYALTLKGRQSWPTFLGDWAFANGGHSHKRRNSTGSINTESCECSSEDDVFTDEDDDDDEGCGEPEAKKPFFFLAEDMDSGDSSPTESITIFNSNIQQNSRSQTETKADLHNNNDLTCKRTEILDNETKHVTELTQPELFNLDDARKTDDSKKFGCSSEGILAAVVVPFPGNMGNITPPIVVELWDEPHLVENRISAGSKMDSHQQASTADDNKNNALTSSQFMREEREPTPFFRNDDSKASTPHLEDKSKPRDLHIPGQNLAAETAKEFHRELTPFYENKNPKQKDCAGISALSLGVPDPGVFQRESTPFYKDVPLKSQPPPTNNNNTDLSTSLAAPIALAEIRDTRGLTPHLSETDPFAESRSTLGQETGGVQKDKTESKEGPSLRIPLPKTLQSLPDTTTQTVKPKLQPISQDFAIGLEVAANITAPTHSKAPQLVRPALRSSEHIDPRSIKAKSPETLASQAPSTLEITKKPALFTSSPTTNPTLAFDPQQPNNGKQHTAGQLPESDKQKEKLAAYVPKLDFSKSSEENRSYTQILSPDSSNKETPQTLSAVSQITQTSLMTQQNLDKRQQKSDHGDKERKIDTELEETAQRVRNTSQSKQESEKLSQTLPSTPSSLYAKRAQISSDKLATPKSQIEPGMKTPPLPQPESSKMAQNKNTSLEIQKQATDVSKSQTERKLLTKIQPGQTENLLQKIPQKEKITTPAIQVVVSPNPTQETYNSTAISNLKEVKIGHKPSLDDHKPIKQESISSPLVNSDVQTLSLVKGKNSNPPLQSTVMEVSVRDATHQTLSTPRLDYPIKFQEIKDPQQEVASRQLLVSAKNIYPVEIVANESSNQATGTHGAANQKADTLKTTNQTTTTKLESANQTTTTKLESANQTNRTVSEETATKKKKNARSGFSNSLSSFFNSKRKTDKTDRTDKTEKTDTKIAKEKTKRSIFAKAGNKHKAANITSPAEPEPVQEQPARQQFVSRQTLTKCSPFGPYTLEGFCFLFVLTIFCLHIQLSIEKFVCYVLAAFYTFCVMRLLGVIY